MKFTRLLVSSGAAAIAVCLAGPALAGEIAGHVSDATQTVALQSAQVRIVELDRVVTTGRDGGFVIGELPAGSYTIEVRYVGAQTVTRTVDVPASGTLSVDIALGGANEILVVGQAANQASALSRKREADGVSDVLTRDAIGQFPDQNVAESLRRLPGVNILNDQGEGRFVSVRGLDPELNSSSLNGVRVPAPESDVRSVALDVISSDLIESIEVKKSLTPDMDADTIGASIEINTTSAFDRKKNLFSLKLEGSYNNKTDDLSPKGSFDFSAKLSDNFGVAGGISYYKRKFATDNMEMDGWDEDDGVVYADTVEYRDYDVERERTSASLSFDLKVDDSTTLYARGLYSRFDDQEYRRRLTFEMDESPSSGDANTASFDAEDGEISVQRDLKDRFERQEIRSLVLGGDTNTGGWDIKYSGSWAKSSEKEHGSFDPFGFEQKFEGPDLFGVTFDYADPRRTYYTIDRGEAAFLDPGNYEFDKLERTTLSDSQDEEYALKLDIARTIPLGMGDFTVQAGGKMRWRDKFYNADIDVFESDITMADGDLLGTQDYSIIDIQPVLSPGGARDFFYNNEGLFELDDGDTWEASNDSDYSVSEDIAAAYLLGKFDSGDLRVIGGVRMEHTKNEINGQVLDLDEETITALHYERSYTDWLPSLNLRFEPSDGLVLRAAAYKSLVRPKLSKLAPRVVIEDNEGEFGNPLLKPYEAWNFDAGVEYYFGSNAALTAGVFYKDIKNYSVDQTIEDYDYNGGTLDQATLPINGDSATVKGIEIGYSQAFEFLPAPFDGLLLQANYTYTDATGTVLTDGEIDDPRTIALPASSKNTFNLVIGYEKGPISLRAAGTYRDGYLDEVGDTPEEDRYVASHFQIDLSAKYKITSDLQVFAEWVNVNNAKYFAYQNFEDRQRLLQYEEYSWTAKFGVRLSL